ncbi:hypothetical protein HFO42_07485 [Rhizobium leguminosarum]|uniref:Uncharacterized protein n=1 Tax=Rhizobium leguminosarum TaxID=384 RepID=A0AAJ1A5X7_RHILE|nr:hypothetical protein [Rhizobium leguminosarum]MBY5532841.1 hypothetical protein [Rhizobium leguminosarum]MBY5594281.1 hypothetical protein [Rhizobium leguminosarum]MBY5627958.1 hypothetical protein [Rhizobium leguminosarum]
MSRDAEMQCNPEEAAAFKLAIRSVECGSLLSLGAAVDRAARLGMAMDDFPWSLFLERRKAWEAVELEFGPGSVLNLSHPLIERMRKETSDALRRDPAHFANAERYRATVATVSELYARVA